MGKAMEILVGAQDATAINTLEPVVMLAGVSNTLRAAAPDSRISLVSAWGEQETEGQIQIRSPLMHDNVMGYTAPVSPLVAHPLWPKGIIQPLFSHDVLTLQVAALVAADEESIALVVHYDDLPGASAMLISGNDVRANTQHVLTIFNLLAAGAVDAWQGEEALNAENDLLKSGRKYALLGCTTDYSATCVRWRSSDWANLGVGVPCPLESPGVSSNWFVDMSDSTGIPLVPVLDADNLGAVLIDKYQIIPDAVGTRVGTVLALLNEDYIPASI